MVPLPLPSDNFAKLCLYILAKSDQTRPKSLTKFLSADLEKVPLFVLLILQFNIHTCLTHSNTIASHSWFFKFALLACVTAFLVQITTLADEMINPAQTVVNTHRLNLSQLETFPLVFKLCIQPGYNQTALWEAGYSEVDL